MSAEYLANVDYTLKVTPDPQTSLWVPGKPTEVRVSAPAVDAPSGKDVLVTQITYAFAAVPVAPATPCSFAGHTFVAGAGSIQATAVKVKCSGLKPIRENDEGSCIGSFTNNSSGATVPCKCMLKIESAGQSKVKGV